MTAPADNTPYPIITDALRDCGKLMQNQAPSSEQLAEGMRRLRDMINFQQTQGIKLWLQVDTAVPLVAEKSVYTFAPGGDINMVKPLRALQGYYLFTASNTRRPIYPMSWNDYLTLGQAGDLAANQGTISQYFVNKQATQLIVTFWLCPDANEAAQGEAHLLLETQVTNPISLTETMAFPVEWRMALHWGLAYDWSTGQPDSVIQRCQMNSEKYWTALTDWDVEDASTSFQPDVRMSAPRKFV